MCAREIPLGLERRSWPEDPVAGDPASAPLGAAQTLPLWKLSPGVWICMKIGPLVLTLERAGERLERDGCKLARGLKWTLLVPHPGPFTTVAAVRAACCWLTTAVFLLLLRYYAQSKGTFRFGRLWVHAQQPVAIGECYIEDLTPCLQVSLTARTRFQLKPHSCLAGWRLEGCVAEVLL